MKIKNFFIVFGKFFYFIGHPPYILLASSIKLCSQIGKLLIALFAKLTFLSKRISKSLILTLFEISKICFRKFKLGKNSIYTSFKIFKKMVLVGLRGFFSWIIKNFSPSKKIKALLKYSPKISFPRRLYFLVIFLTIVSFLSWRIHQDLLKDLPSPEKLINRPIILSTKIYDRHDQLLYKIYRHQNRTLVPLNKIPSFLIQATIAIEDKEFWQHRGISLKGILRAIRHNLIYPNKEPIGGSTITQQLIKNALLGPEKTWQRKIKEAILAVLVEARFEKKEILQMYFNEVPYGGTTYGAEEAAQKYFGKSVVNLDSAEMTLLAGLPAAPTRYSPFGAYPALAKKRQKQVLEAMVKSDYLDKNKAEEIIQAPLKFTFKGNHLKAPHFVFYTKDILVEKYGQKLIEEGGLEVTTSLDLELQRKAEKVIREELAKVSHLNVGNAAVLIIRPPTGEILAMVGSKDYFDFNHDGNVNVTLSLRQPGSAIKIVNYAVAFQQGFTPATIISDTPISFRLPHQKAYSPKNYNNKFHGNVSIRTALGSSLNVPAVKVLASLGVDKMIAMGQKMGITSWENPNRFGLSLTLGGGEIKMIDLAQAYTVLANLGEKIPLAPLLEINRGKENLFRSDQEANSEAVLNPGAAFILNDILSDNRARSLAFGPHSLLNIPQKTVAVKTGTSNNLRDNWAIGYTPQFLVAVWVGNNNNQPMSQIASGITGATPIWRRLIDYLLQEYPQTGWPKPKNVISLPICRTTGTLPCQNCPRVENEYFLDSFVPQKHCSPQQFAQSEEAKNQ